MAITFVGAGTFTSGTGALSVPWPAGYADGDVGILVTNSANSTIPGPTVGPWTGISTIGTGTSAAIGSVYVRMDMMEVAGAQVNESVPDSGSYTAAQIFVFRGADISSVLYIGANEDYDAAATTAITCPGVGFTGSGDLYPAGSMVVQAIGLDKDLTGTNTITGAIVNASLSSIAKRADSTTVSGVGGGIALITGLVTTDTDWVQNTTSTADTSTKHAYITVMLDAKNSRLNSLPDPCDSIATADLTTISLMLADSFSEAFASAVFEYAFPYAGYGIESFATLTADLTTVPYVYGASATCESTCTANGINSSSIALSSTLPAATLVATNEQQFWTGGHGTFAGELNGTIVITGGPHIYYEDDDGNDVWVHERANYGIMFKDGYPYQQLRAIPEGPWMAARGLKDTLWFVMTYHTYSYVHSWGYSEIYGYLANSPTQSGPQDGNVVKMTMPFAARWSDITYGNGIYLAVACMESAVASMRYCTSPDGIAWTIRTFASGEANHCQFFAGKFRRGDLESTDGIAWTTASTSAFAPLKVIKGLDGNPDLLVRGDGYCTTNGTTWHPGYPGHGWNVTAVSSPFGPLHFSSHLTPGYANPVMGWSSDNGQTWATAPCAGMGLIDLGDPIFGPGNNAAMWGGGALLSTSDCNVTAVSWAYKYNTGTFRPMYPSWYKVDYQYSPVAGSSSCRSKASATIYNYMPLGGEAAAEASFWTETALFAKPGRELSMHVYDMGWPFAVGAAVCSYAFPSEKVLLLSASDFVGTGNATTDINTRVTTQVIGTPSFVQVINFNELHDKLIGFNGTGVYYSINGLSWVLAYTHSVAITGISFVAGEFVLHSTASSAIACSPDGITWTAVSILFGGVDKLFESNGFIYASRYLSSVSYEVVRTNIAGWKVSNWTTTYTLTNLKLIDVWYLKGRQYLAIGTTSGSMYLLLSSVSGSYPYDTETPTYPANFNSPPYIRQDGILIGMTGFTPADHYYSEDGVKWDLVGRLNSTDYWFRFTGTRLPNGKRMGRWKVNNNFIEYEYCLWSKAVGTLSTLPATLQGKAVGECTFSGTLPVDNRLSGSGIDFADAWGSLDILVQFDATSYGVATLDGDLTVPQVVMLDSTSFGEAIASGDFTAPKIVFFDAGVAAVSAADAGLTIHPAVYLDGTAASDAQSAAILTVPAIIFFDCSAACAASLDADLTIHPRARLEAAVQCEPSVSVWLLTNITLSGDSLASAASASAALTTEILLRAQAVSALVSLAEMDTAIRLSADTAAVAQSSGKIDVLLMADSVRLVLSSMRLDVVASAVTESIAVPSASQEIWVRGNSSFVSTTTD